MPHFDVIRSYTMVEVAQRIEAETAEDALQAALSGEYFWKECDGDYDRDDAGEIAYTIIEKL